MVQELLNPKKKAGTVQNIPIKLQINNLKIIPIFYANWKKVNAKADQLKSTQIVDWGFGVADYGID